MSNGFYSKTTSYKHKCLKYFYEFEDYSGAEKMCKSIEGTLISIHSTEENYFALDLANRENPQLLVFGSELK